MTSPTYKPLEISLFDLILDKLDDELPIVECTKATLVHLSHTLEDVVLKQKLPALLFTGFQESSHWRQETERYLALSQVVHQVCVFAGKPLPPESEASQLHIELADNDMLRQEWFVIILSERFSVLLCGQDNLNESSNPEEATRLFKTIWSFEPEIINKTLDVLETVIGYYRPERLESIQQARVHYPPATPDPRLLTQFTLDLVQFEERLNAELRWQTRLKDTLLQSISHFVIVWKIVKGQRQMLYISPNIKCLVNYHAEELVANWQNLFDKIILPEDYELVRQYLHRVEESIGQLPPVEYRIFHANGGIAWVRASDSVVWNATDNTRDIYTVIEDITNQKSTETMRIEQEKLRLELEQERELNAVKSYFMTTVSHEFRTPLSTILLATDMLSRYDDLYDPAQRQEKFERIRTQVLHLTKMLDDIAIVINNRANSLAFQPSPTALHAFFESALRDFNNSEPHAQHITLHYDATTTDPTALLMIDTQLVRMMFLNLLSNAVKYSPPKSRVECRVIVEERWITLSVRDAGIGIPLHDRPHIFEAFYRGSNAGHIPGAGLGLSMVKDSVALHQGIVSYDTESGPEGQGCTFIIKLPAVFYVK